MESSLNNSFNDLSIEQEQHEIMTPPSTTTASDNGLRCFVNNDNFGIDDTDVAAFVEVFDVDLKVERIRFALGGWSRFVHADCTRLWCGQDMETVLLHFGKDPRHVQKEWRSHTIEWIKEHLTHGTEEEALEQEYKKYVRRFQKITSAIKDKKRQDDLDAALQRHNDLFSPTVDITAATFHSIAHGAEGSSVLFHLLQQRPDLIKSQ